VPISVTRRDDNWVKKNEMKMMMMMRRRRRRRRNKIGTKREK